MSSGVTSRRPSAACAPTECADLVVRTWRGSTLVASADSLSPAAVPSRCRKVGVRRLGELADGVDPHGRKPGTSHRADAPNQPDRQRIEKLPLLPDRDDDQPVGLGNLRCDLGQVLRAGHADRDGQADLVLDPAANRRRNADGRTEQGDRASDVEERLVNRDAFNQRREVVKDRHDLIAEALVLVKVAADEAQGRTQLAGSASRHPAADAERARFVRGGQHDATADRDRNPAQGRVEELLDGRIERVEVSVQNRRLPAGPHAQALYSNTCSRSASRFDSSSEAITLEKTRKFVVTIASLGEG